MKVKDRESEEKEGWKRRRANFFTLRERSLQCSQDQISSGQILYIEEIRNCWFYLESIKESIGRVTEDTNYQHQPGSN